MRRRKGIEGSTSTRRRALAAALLATVAIGMVPVLAPPSAQAQAGAQRLSFSIPSGPLASALAAFGRTSGLQVTYRPEIAADKMSPGVTGVLAPAEALDRILQGSDLTYRFTNPTTVAVSEIPGGTGQTGPDGAPMLEPIIVTGASESAWGPVDGYIARQSATATKTDTPVIETPQSISIVGRDQIDIQGAQQVKQALRYTPGLATDIRGDISRFDQIYIRGIGAVTDSFQYLDGLRLPRGTSYLIPQIDPYDLERVEVLKGPASVLYGQAPLGGLVNLVSKRPTETPFGEVEFQAGSHDRFQGGFDLGGPLTEDGSLLYRLTGIARDADTSVRLTEEQRFSIAPAVTWTPNADTSLTILGLYQRDPKGGYYGVLPSRGTILPNPNGKIPRDFFDGSPDFNTFNRTQAAIGYQLDHRLDERWSLHQNVRYWHMDLDQSVVYSTGLRADGHTLNRVALWSDESLDAVNLDTRLQGDLQTGPLRHTAVFGIDYQWDNWQQTQGFGPAPGLDYLDPDYSQPITRPAAYTSPDRTENLLGLYAQDQIRLDQLSLLLGGRFDRAAISNENDLAGTSTDQVFTKFTWRAAAIYNFDNGLAPYASYSTSFDPSVTANAYGPPFQPTTGEQYEIGIKYQPPGFDGLFTVAAFDLRQQNVLTRDPTPGAPINAYVQTGEIRSRGIEVEAKVSPIEGLNLIGSFTWLDPEVTRSNGPDLHKRPVSVPRTTASAWGDYTLRDGTLGGLTLGAGLRYVGSAYADAANTQEIPDYVVFDASLRYDLSRLDSRLDGTSALLTVTNLFDRVTYTCNAADFCNYGQGRTILGTLKYRW
ncbi:TonB-dependent siderophore receptor [Inquilinus sp. CA228]|uniref:TonB-dependent siderophore receptor n=1 Tax=Inquilinus sp. CA228 TaxID=3455609 RepID=UPI003F8D631F